MISPDLIVLLCCPETRQPVALADPACIERLNLEIRAGRVPNRAGRLVSEPVEAGLVRADGEVLYPIREGIPVMLIEEAILMPR